MKILYLSEPNNPLRAAPLFQGDYLGVRDFLVFIQ